MIRGYTREAGVYRLPTRIGGGQGDQLRIQLRQPGVEMVDRQQVVIQDSPLGGMRPREAVDPPPVRLGPRTTPIMQPPAKQEFAEAVPPSLPLRARVIPGPAQVPAPLPRLGSADAPPSADPPDTAPPASPRPAGRS